MEQEPVKADYAGSVTIAGVPLRCYVAQDGRQIIDCDDVREFIAALEAGAEVTPEDAMRLSELVQNSKVMEQTNDR